MPTRRARGRQTSDILGGRGARGRRSARPASTFGHDTPRTIRRSVGSIAAILAVQPDGRGSGLGAVGASGSVDSCNSPLIALRRARRPRAAPSTTHGGACPCRSSIRSPGSWIVDRSDASSLDARRHPSIVRTPYRGGAVRLKRGQRPAIAAIDQSQGSVIGTQRVEEQAEREEAARAARVDERPADEPQRPAALRVAGRRPGRLRLREDLEDADQPRDARGRRAGPTARRARPPRSAA